jgi:hypothetical protein
MNKVAKVLLVLMELNAHVLLLGRLYHSKLGQVDICTPIAAFSEANSCNGNA